MGWFQGTADAVRQFTWVFEVGTLSLPQKRKKGRLSMYLLKKLDLPFFQDNKNKNIEHVLILSGDQLYRMDYMDLVQVRQRSPNAIFNSLFNDI